MRWVNKTAAAAATANQWRSSDTCIDCSISDSEAEPLNRWTLLAFSVGTNAIYFFSLVFLSLPLRFSHAVFFSRSAFVLDADRCTDNWNIFVSLLSIIQPRARINIEWKCVCNIAHIFVTKSTMRKRQTKLAAGFVLVKLRSHTERSD